MKTIISFLLHPIINYKRRKRRKLLQELDENNSLYTSLKQVDLDFQGAPETSLMVEKMMRRALFRIASIEKQLR